MTTHGPCESGAQVARDVNHIYRAFGEHGADDPELIGRISAGLTIGTLRAARVETATLDLMAVGRLAELPPEYPQIIRGWVERAYTAGRDQLADEMAELHARIDALETAARRAAPVGMDLADIRSIVDGRAGR